MAIATFSGFPEDDRPSKTPPIYENELFEVRRAAFTDPVLNEQVEGYGVFNKRTKIREAEARREFTARALADGFQDQHRNPEKYIEPPAPDYGQMGTPTGGTAH